MCALCFNAYQCTGSVPNESNVPGTQREKWSAVYNDITRTCKGGIMKMVLFRNELEQLRDLSTCHWQKHGFRRIHASLSRGLCRLLFTAPKIQLVSANYLQMKRHNNEMHINNDSLHAKNKAWFFGYKTTINNIDINMNIVVMLLISIFFINMMIAFYIFSIPNDS